MGILSRPRASGILPIDMLAQRLCMRTCMYAWLYHNVFDKFSFFRGVVKSLTADSFLRQVEVEMREGFRRRRALGQS